MEIVDRVTAFQNGLARFFNGRRCKNGHLSERYVSNGACISCLRPTHDLKLVSLRIRCHEDDVTAFKDMEQALLSARAIAAGIDPDEPPPAATAKRTLSREERERNHAKKLLQLKQPWRPMSPAPYDPDYTGPEPVDAIQATLDRKGL